MFKYSFFILMVVLLFSACDDGGGTSNPQEIHSFCSEFIGSGFGLFSDFNCLDGCVENAWYTEEECIEYMAMLESIRICQECKEDEYWGGFDENSCNCESRWDYENRHCYDQLIEAWSTWDGNTDIQQHCEEYVWGCYPEDYEFAK